METPYNLFAMQAEQNEGAKYIAHKLKTEMIDQQKMGISTAQGFYSYPNPAYQKEDFTKSN